MVVGSSFGQLLAPIESATVLWKAQADQALRCQ